MIHRLDAAFTNAGRKRDADFQIIVTPPLSMPIDSMQAYAELGVHRLLVHIGNQQPEPVDQCLVDIEKSVKLAA